MTTYTSWINDSILIEVLEKTIQEAEEGEDTTLYEKTLKILQEDA